LTDQKHAAQAGNRQYLAIRRALGEELAERGCQVRYRDPLAAHPLRPTSGDPEVGGIGNHDRRAQIERRKNVPLEGIVRQAGKKGETIVRAELELMAM